MIEICLICGVAHKHAIRGGKVGYLRHCFRREGHGRTFWRASPRRMVAERRAREVLLQNAVNAWGVSE